VPDDITDGLRGRGLDFVRACWRTYTGWSPTSRALLRQAGTLLDALDANPNERAAQRLLLATLQALNLKD
jgi:hypothetical protein